MTPSDLTAALKNEAARLGFGLVGACEAVSPPSIEQFRQWLAAGHAGQMEYLATRAEAYAHPRHVLEGVRSLLVLGTAYRTADPLPLQPGQGRVSRYAWGTDYHDVIRRRLHRLADVHRQLAPQAVVRGVIDTAPLLERDFARLAGLGWIGKNTLLLNRRLGSWLFLAVLLTSEELAYDEPSSADYCGTCRACLEACPTGALVAPYQLDARRCISYLTIELRGPIAEPLRPGLGDWLFGCDVCQDVCPWNRRVPQASEPELEPLADMNPVELAALLDLDEAAFRARFRHTPLARARRGGILRNAAILLGNRPHPAAQASLIRGAQDPDPTIRAACVWALTRYPTAG